MHTFFRSKIIIISSIGIVLSAHVSTVTFAHEGHIHTDESVGATERTLSRADMERMIVLLEEVVALLALLHSSPDLSMLEDTKLPTPETVTTPTPVTPLVTPTTTPEKKLIVEVEEHHGQTHVHVRYIDKPEEMFFVSPKLDDEQGILKAIESKTGITQEEIKKALVYFR